VLQKKTLEEVGAKYKRTRERIRQVVDKSHARLAKCSTGELQEAICSEFGFKPSKDSKSSKFIFLKNTRCST
jgi:hypothetical protein